MLLRRVIGDALRARRQGQHRTLREISLAANVSLGYLSEIERGQKEASSELLAAICQALGSQLSEVLREASDSLAQVERTDHVLADALRAGELPSLPEQARPATPARSQELPVRGDAPHTRPVGEPALAPAGSGSAGSGSAGGHEARTVTDGEVSVSVRRDGPLRTTLHAVRARRRASRH